MPFLYNFLVFISNHVVYICIFIPMKKFLLLILILLLQKNTFAQQTRISRSDYIANYSNCAIKEMKRTGIPASITLAQGCLESDDGNSWLAREANNHFGIKCHNWEGNKVYQDDDDKKECFRKYSSAKKSYDDHSDFLVNTKRYAVLFQLNPRDYKGWAKGLKEAGYATNPKYPELLIKIIEDNKLYEFDRGNKTRREKTDTSKTKQKQSHRKLGDVDNFSITTAGREIKLHNRIKFIVAKNGDTPDAIAKEIDVFTWELLRYNDLTRDSVLRQGQILYIQPKRNKAEFGKNTHIVKEGETFYSISQLYGIKLNKLLLKNNLNLTDSIKVGNVLNLRKRKMPETK
ncbi:MAG: hypothetical protein COX07_09250 [Bacteroidetes bacterium CG23_combo_of_CG06-09_8_20_14_all_32_9]|nr:MAG: hypothetical protein COX07_09250 [Bacteroidetes bacterium CG23_combo_of_CG06-09_8_20_14_all_32_9]